MAALTTQRPLLDGTAVTYGAATAGGDTFTNDGKSFLHAKNGSGGALVVTVAAIYECSHGSSHNAVVSVPAGGERIIGPFPTNQFGENPAITYSGVTSLTVAAVGL